MRSATVRDPRPAAWRAAAVLLPLALLAACASRPPAADGPGERPPPGLERVPDAVPRIEPLRPGGPNKPYEVFGRRYVPMTGDLPLAETGLASWYGRKFHGRPTASGEIYDMYAMTAAHKTMPIPSYARVRNPANGREVVVRINDRGPFADGRVIDLSYTAALRLGLLRGVAPVQLARITHDEIRAGVAAAQPAPATLPAAQPALGGLAAVALPPDDPAPGGLATTAPGLWLQLGAFRARDGALALQRRLLDEPAADGLPVAVFEEGDWFRVQAGPYASEAEAQRAGEQLRRRLGLASVPVRRR